MFEFNSTGPTSGQIFHQGELVAEIREMCLANVRFRPGGKIIIGENVPLPLFWWQYANHENPEQNTGANGKLELLANTKSGLIFQCTGSNFSQSALSRIQVEMIFDSELRRFSLQILAELTIPAGKKWKILPNPAHGEIEFCNLWPEASFGTEANSLKKYQACFAEHAGLVTRIPHHHLETRDKQNIPLSAGDRFLWLLEDENPVIEILSSPLVSAGVCAYQWDAHFGCRVGNGRDECWLAGMKKCVAEYRLYTIDRAAGSRIATRATEVISPEDLEIPIFVPGVNSFGPTLRDFPDPSGIWPWQFSGSETAKGRICRTRGFRDTNSLEIENSAGTAQWLFTALGPAFGQPPFPDGVRLRLSGYLSSENLQGEAFLALRWHREGHGSVFRLEDYEIHTSPVKISGTSGWTFCEVVTPPVSPAPDRVHLILQQNGRGRCWFDEVGVESF